MRSRAGVLLLVAVQLCFVMSGRAEQACIADRTGLIVRDESVPWPFSLAPGMGITINVLSNDNDGQGGTLTLSSNPTLSAPVGSVSRTSDLRSIYFVPATPSQFPPGLSTVTITYQVSSSTGSQATGRAIFTRDDATAAPILFNYVCQGRECQFNALPRGPVRSFAWRFAGYPTCDITGWRGLGHLCTFPAPTGESQTTAVTLEISYQNGTREQYTDPAVKWFRLEPRFTWDWWKARTGAPPETEDTDGLAVAAWIHACPTCQQLCSSGPIDELYWDWGESGFNRVPIRTQDQCAAGGHLGYPEKVNHIYREPGRYTVRALLRVGGAGPDVPYPPLGFPVEVAPRAPQIELTRLTGPGWADELWLKTDVLDDAFGVSPPAMDKGPTGIQWDYGDGEIEDKAAPLPLSGDRVTVTAKHRYRKAGRYITTVRTTNAAGRTATARSEEIVVDNVRPEAKFQFQCDNLVCTFDGSGSTDDGTISQYSWQLGAGASTSSSQPVISYTFPTTGIKRVGLSVSDNLGRSSGYTYRDVTVARPLSAPLAYYLRRVPCRALDTRWAWERRWSSGEQRSFLPSNPYNCYPPSEAAAVDLNVAVVAPGGAGWLAVLPVGYEDSTVPATATLNFDNNANPWSGHVVATVPGWSGKVTVFPDPGKIADAHVIVDLQGFYADPSTINLPGLCTDASPWCGPFAFKPMPQNRLMDTRANPPVIGAGQTRYMKLTSNESPSAPLAYWLNLTAIAQGNGYLTLFNSAIPPQAFSGVSNLTYGAGRIQTHSVISELAQSASDIGITATFGGTDVVLDLAAQFIPLSPARTGLFRSLNPCRAFDSRSVEQGGGAKITSKEPLRLQLAGNCGVPPGAMAVVAYVAAITPDAAGYLKAWPSNTSAPAGVILSFQGGQVIGNTTVMPLGPDGRVILSPTLFVDDAYAGLDLIVDVVGYFGK